MNKLLLTTAAAIFMAGSAFAGVTIPSTHVLTSDGQIKYFTDTPSAQNGLKFDGYHIAGKNLAILALDQVYAFNLIDFMGMNKVQIKAKIKSELKMKIKDDIVNGVIDSIDQGSDEIADKVSDEVQQSVSKEVTETINTVTETVVEETTDAIVEETVDVVVEETVEVTLQKSDIANGKLSEELLSKADDFISEETVSEALSTNDELAAAYAQFQASLPK